MTSQQADRDTSRPETFDTAWLDSKQMLSVERSGVFTRRRLGAPNGAGQWMALSAPWSHSLAAQRLEDEHSRIGRLDPTYVRPGVLIRTPDGPVLVFEDAPSARQLIRPQDLLSIGEVLGLASQAATALAHLHEHGLLHGDLRPESWSWHGGRLRLTELGQAQERPPLTVTPVADDALPYAAPEAARRTKPRADHRSDLYALGVTLFELATGQHPFSGETPADWLHAHLAILPARPSATRSDLPMALDAILLKLLAKNPEARYQSAISLSRDLARCHAAWIKDRTIAAFPLDGGGAKTLYTPRLVGREEELAALKAAFRRVLDTGSAEAVLIGGPTGSGKSLLVETFLETLTPGSFIQADGQGQLARSQTPYGLVMPALRRALNELLDLTSEAQEGRRARMTQTLGVHAKLLIDLLPPFERLLGPAPPGPDTPAAETRSRLNSAILTMLGVCAEPDRPMIVILDDLQWADPSSWSLLSAFLSHPPPNVLLIGLHRPDPIGLGAPVEDLASAVTHGARVSALSLEALGVPQIAAMMSQAMLCAPSKLADLPRLIHDKTGGNPYFAMQFLRALIDEQILLRHPGVGWRWNDQEVLKRGQTDNVVDLVLTRFDRLDAESRMLLQHLAWVGAKSGRALLGQLAGISPEHLAACAERLTESGFVIPVGEALAFCSDRIWEAAYALTPPADRPLAHARVARALLGLVNDSGELDFEIANQIQLTSATQVGEADRGPFAEALLTAARRAKGAVALDQATLFLETGLRILGQQAWSHAPQHACQTTLLLCECLLSQSRIEEAAHAADQVLEQALAPLDRALGFRLRASVRMLDGDCEGAIQACLAGLSLLGVQLPRVPPGKAVQESFLTVERLLDAATVASLADLPVCEDPHLVATLDLLAALGASAWVSEGLGQLHVAKMVELTLRHGLTPAAPYGLAWFGVIRAHQGAHAQGLALGQSALAIMERHGWTQTKALVLLAMDRLSGWSQPLAQALGFAHGAIQTGLDSADIAVACRARHQLVSDLLALGRPLPVVGEEADRGLAEAQLLGLDDLKGLARAQLAFVSGLQDTLADPTAHQICAAEIDARSCCFSQATVFWELLYSGMTAFLEGRSQAAGLSLTAAQNLSWAAQGHIDLSDLELFLALSNAAQGRAPDPAGLKRLEGWAQSNPLAFRAKSLLAQAEADRTRGEAILALGGYEAAMAAAAQAGQWRERALAHELAGACNRGLGLEVTARAHYVYAHEAYEGWGALRKLRLLERQEPYLAKNAPPAEARPVTDQALLDTNAALQAAQTLSEEIVLDRLIEKLMLSTLIHAGADYGVLMLVRDEALQIEATARVLADSPQVDNQRRPPKSSDLPLALLQAVEESLKPIVLEDAQSIEALASYPHDALGTARSTACLPLVKRGALVGVLYLENGLLPGVFTPSRTALLELLASQAAISLENARLYAEGLEQSARFQRTEAALSNARAELARNAHLTAMGGLAASIGHEINQPLHSIVTNVDASLRWLKHDPPVIAEALANLRNIGRSAQRAGSIVKGLRALARQDSLALKPVQIDDIVGEVLQLSQSEIAARNATLNVVLQAEGVMVQAEPVQLQQVVFNLLNNAIDAVDGMDERQILVTSTVRNGAVIVGVEDTGRGVPSDLRQKMFDPLFTTKQTGMGMGLAICRTIIEAHGGRLDLAPASLGGARLEFELPLDGHV